MKKLLIAAFAAFALGVNAQTEVNPYRPGITENGITYFLPNTNLHVTVKVKRVTHVPGEYCKYAERFLRLKGVTMSAYDSWELAGVEIVPSGVANKDQAYTIKLKSKTAAPLVGLSPDGCLLTVNTPSIEIPALSVPSVGEPTTDKVSASDFKTEEISLAGSTSKMAELTADEIFDFRENRALLAKGQADFMPKDGEQLKLMLESLDKQENGLLQLFKGYSITEEHTFTYDFTPKGEVNNHVLFRFSKHLGIVDADDLAGAPVCISVRDLKSLPPVAEVDGKKKEVEDLRYMVPGKAQVDLTYNRKKLISLSLPMSQFGRVEHLGGDLFNKKFTTKVTLFPETGGIHHIDMEQPEK